MSRGYWMLSWWFFGLVCCFSLQSSWANPLQQNTAAMSRPSGPYRIKPVHVNPSPGHSYAPLGWDWRYKITPHWDMALLLEYQWMTYNPTASISRIHTDTLQTIDSAKVPGHGVLAAIQFIGNYLEQDFVIQPYYRLWDAQGFGSNNGSATRWNSLRPDDPGREIREYGIHLTWRF